MSQIAVRVENLGKRYRIGARQSRYRTLREALVEATSAPFHWLDPRFTRGDAHSEHIWALKDVTCEIKHGEVVGIIGRNGAGKTTLLRILSRITKPTEGYAEIHGRVGSLLEVGTGFHPELTGRENIYLNGAILGMKRIEIDHKFDEIVAFAEIEKFLDTPVKHYSSGMYVRLAFAVAAHLEPEILLVDEVLAVGDAAFQKKCLGKMGDVAKEGRTVLFVSHNMPSIIRLCPRTLWVSEGHIKLDGPTTQVVGAYLLDGTSAMGERTWEDISNAPGNNRIRLRGVRVCDSDGNIQPTVNIQLPFHVEIEYQILEKIPPMRMAFTLCTNDGLDVFTSTDMADFLWAERVRLPGKYTSKCTIPGNLLAAGEYVLRVGADVPFKEVLFICDNALAFEVVETGGVSGRLPEKWAGIICPKLAWSVFQLEEAGIENGQRTQDDSRASI